MKTVIRKAVRAAKKWLQDGENMNKTMPREFSYDWLNRYLLPRILKEGGPTFRPPYTWGVLQGVNLAKAIDINRVSIIEFGVAGGNGLIALEEISAKIESIYEVEIEVYGFDTGVGLPKPEDNRDLPNIYSEGRHPMETEKLRERLKRAQLMLGLVADTVEDFIQSEPPPAAFIAVDLDFYSSTIHALRLLDARQELLLPRICCYFDDIMGLTCGDCNGERLAISDFNSSHETRKISQIYGLKYFLPQECANAMWAEMFYMAHIFDHDEYGRFDRLAPLYDLSLQD